MCPALPVVAAALRRQVGRLLLGDCGGTSRVTLREATWEKVVALRRNHMNGLQFIIFVNIKKNPSHIGNRYGVMYSLRL
jgi:hypothetical protein